MGAQEAKNALTRVAQPCRLQGSSIDHLPISCLWPTRHQHSTAIEWRCYLCSHDNPDSIEDCIGCCAPRELDFDQVDLGAESDLLAYFRRTFDVRWERGLIGPTGDEPEGAGQLKRDACVKYMNARMRDNGYYDYEYTGFVS